jgi:hypothetical protein
MPLAENVSMYHSIDAVLAELHIAGLTGHSEGHGKGYRGMGKLFNRAAQCLWRYAFVWGGCCSRTDLMWGIDGHRCDRRCPAARDSTSGDKFWDPNGRQLPWVRSIPLLHTRRGARFPT